MLTVDGQVTIVGGRNIGDEYFGATQDVESLLADKLPQYWVPVRMVSDDPGKVLGRAPPEALITAHLKEVLGFVIESKGMAHAMSETFDHKIPYRAYRLELDGQGNIVWLERCADGVKTLTSEPSTSFRKRLYAGFLSWLPIEPLL